LSSKVKMAGRERRQAIIEAAKELFSQRGFRGTTTRELAAAIGVSEPVLYQHFATKRDLYTAIIDQKSKAESEKFRALLDDATKSNDDRAFFQRLASLIFRWHSEDPAYIRLLLYSGLEGHELATMSYERQAVRFFEAIAAHIRKRMEAGAFRNDIDPLDAARAFVGMVSHFAQAIVIFHSPQYEAGNCERRLEAMIEIFLSGMQKVREVRE